MRKPDESARSLSRAIRQTPILYDDDCLVAVDKASGLLTAPSHFDAPAPTLIEEMTKRLRRENRLAPQARLFVAHSLEIEESGVVLFAKDKDTHKALSEIFAERQPSRAYCAIVHGQVASDAGSIDLPIGLAPGDRSRMVVRKRKGRASRTDFAVVERFVFHTYLRLYPLTERRHQMRVHLSAVGHPVAGDDLYGDGKGIFLSELKRSYRAKPGQREAPLMGRLALHAAELRFCHPRGGQQVVIEAKPPKDFRATLRNMKRFMAR